MNFIGNIKVMPKLPAELSRLQDLANNLYFSWSPEARQLFRLIDANLWTNTNHNPIKFLQEVDQNSLEKCAQDPSYLAQFKKVLVEFDQYMNANESWYATNFPSEKNKVLAYFSAEFGIHESLPVYSGGLGVLSGDHLKSASDLGLPLVGISLFYHQTYFTQQIDAHGNQIAHYEPHHPGELALTPALDSQGKQLKVTVQIATHAVNVAVWQAAVGRITAYLLDTNLPENAPEDRVITSRLYGGDEEMRISQEIVLGMAGVKTLRALGIEPAVWHMNEGHSVFLALERIRELIIEQGLTFNHACEVVSSNTVFTTHTPVPAGNDAFPLHFVDKYFQKYWESVGIRRYRFMELGSQIQPEGYEIFNLTILALKLSRFRNGVSKLHGEVSRDMWQDVWPATPVDEIPITHITNGVHAATWTVYKMRKLFDEYLGPNWENRIEDEVGWKSVFDVPDPALWQTKLEIKEILFNHIRERLYAQNVRNRTGTLELHRLKGILDTNALTIGFARRFATYKRGTLIFKDKERLKRILNDPERPVQLIFAGKAHPKDKGGQAFIQKICELAREEDFYGKVIFVENYDMSLARDLVSGVDVWLNNPCRPQEASGTSGQKAGMNGVVNFSVLDGWWVEGYNGSNGFAFGDREDYDDPDELDTWDSEAIYDILEKDLVPLYYDRDENGTPRRWLQMVKHSIASVSPNYNTHRMVRDYVTSLYLPALKNGEEYTRNDFAASREFSQWREIIEDNWSSIKAELKEETITEHRLSFDESFKLQVQVDLGTIRPEDVTVQVYLSQRLKDVLETSSYQLVEMKRKKTLDDGVYMYEAKIRPSNSGFFDYAVRIMPQHSQMAHAAELGLVYWLRD